MVEFHLHCGREVELMPLPPYCYPLKVAVDNHMWQMGTDSY